MNELGLLNVWWMVREDIQIGITDMHTVLTKHGFDPEIMHVPSDKECVRRGIDSFHNRRGYNRRVVEKISETPTKAVFGILGISLDKEHENSSYLQNTKVVLDKNNGVVSAEGELSDEVIDRVDSFRGTYNSDDIRMLCKNVILSCCGTSKRPTGGVYMIPYQFDARIKALNEVLKEVAGKLACLYCERIYGGEEEKNNAAASVFDDLGKRVEVLVKNVSRVTKQVCRMKSKKVQLDEINYLAGIYHEILGNQEAIEGFNMLFKSAAEKIEQTISELTVVPVTSAKL